MEREFVTTRGNAVVAGPQSRGRLRQFVFALITVSLTVVVCLGSAEILLRFLPVQSGLRTHARYCGEPGLSLHARTRRDLLARVEFRHGQSPAGQQRRLGKRSRLSAQDDETPLLAIVGDSYVEALMVPYAQTLYGRLAKKLAGQLRVYSFGASGAPLSQYLIWARHAVREYGARAVVINLVGNDFDESYIAYNKGPGWWVYAPGPDGTLHLELIEYRPGWLRSVAHQ